MFDQDPLEQLLISALSNRTVQPLAQKALTDDLRTLERWLSIPADVRPKTIPRVSGVLYTSARLAEQDVLPTQDLYRRLMVTKGNGKSYVEPSLIELIALSLDPTTIPFFVEILDSQPLPGDAFANQRRKLALGGLVFFAYQTDHPDAIAALFKATWHALPFVRAQAIHCLKQFFVGVDPQITSPAAAEASEVEEAPALPMRREPTADILARLAEIVTSDPAFAPRFMARLLLAELGHPAAREYPEGAYAFKVTFKHAKKLMSRTVEVLAEQTLEDLHLAIQEALEWDDDHLYAFFMNGEQGDEQYQFSSPWEEDAFQWVSDAVLGELGLVPKHTFLYYFDYGDSHEFDVQVVGIRPEAEPGEYPRVIERTGQAPPQY